MEKPNLPQSSQLSMFPPIDLPPTILEIAATNAAIFPAEFIAWLPDNLHVWEAFAAEVFKVIGRGFTHYSSRTILEVLRHHSAISEHAQPYKLNNNLTPWLPRLFDAAYPRHAGLFEYRTTSA